MTDYNRMNLKQLRQRGREMGLLRVGKNNKTELIERLKKGKQPSDYNKNVLLEHAHNQGILANVTMSKETILKKLSNPRHQDLSGKRLREIAKQRGVRLRGIMPKKDIIKRTETPTAHYTIENLKRLDEDNNIKVRRNITKSELLNRLTEANIISPSKNIEVSNIGVFSDAPLSLITSIRQRTTNAREDLMNYRKYIKNLKVEFITSRRLKQIQKTLEEMEKRAKEEYDRLFEARETESALRYFAKVYTINGPEGYDGRTFLNDAENSITRVLMENRQTKVKLIFKCYMIKEGLDGDIIRQFVFQSNIEVNLKGTDENELYNNMLDTIEEKIQKLEHAEGTGWKLHSVIDLELHTVEWVPLRGSSYIELPEYLKNKKAITNMKNDDDKCFLWCVLRALNPVKKNKERIDGILKSKIDTLNMKDIKYPITLQDIKKFECLNSSISISVLGYDEKEKVYPLRVSEYLGREHDIVLMLICNEERKHYCLVNDLSRLLGAQTSRHLTKRLFCLRCFNSFNCENSLKNHKEYCSTSECIKINIPEKDPLLKFKNYCNSEKVPFIIYADMESLLNPIQSCKPNPQSSYTKKYQKHQPISYSYYIKCFDDNVFTQEPRTYTGSDAMQKFVESLEKDVKEIANIPKVNMIFGKEEAERFNKETKCWICKEDLNDDKVRDHCHFTGRYRGAAHIKCNLKYKKPKFIPVVFHNLSGYDSYLFIKNLGFTAGNIDCIPNNEEKYISFSKKYKGG